MGVSGRRKSVEEGRFNIPDEWPRWKKKCGAKRKNSPGACTQWAVIGMPTCKYHGSGGEKNKELGEIRYLCWIVCGGPQNMPIKYAAKLAVAVWAEHVLNNGKAGLDAQLQAAIHLVDRLT